MIEASRNSIIIRNVDLESKQYKYFERAFSLYNPVRHKYDYSIFYTIGNDIHMPASVTPSAVQTYFTSDVVIKNTNNLTKANSIDFNLLHNPLNDIQTEALTFLNSVMYDNVHKDRMLNLATGKGKTYVTIGCIATIKQVAMIIVDTVDLANQWKNQFLFHTDLSGDDIIILSGKKSIEDAKSGNYKIIIAIHNTLHSIIDEDANGLNDLTNKLHIGIRVFDECHVNFHNICMINSLSNVNYTIYLTATPNRSDFKEDLLFGKVFDSVPSYNGHKEDNEKYHKIILMYFNSHPSDKQTASVKTKYGFCLNKWADFVATDSCYSYYIASLLKILRTFKIVEKNKKVAIMLPTNDLIDKTYNDLEEQYPDIDIGKFIGTVKKDNRQTELEKPIILTNQKMFGKAIDIPDLECVINYIQMSSKVNVEQMIGRLRNNEGYSHVLIDVTDNGYPDCINQQKLRKRFYKKIAKEITEVKENL